MELYCTRPSCPKPQNVFPSLDEPEALKTVKQQFCMTCGMPLILEGRYLTTKILGEGGFGTAYLGRDRLTPRMRQCAIKQFKPAMVMTPQQLTMARDLFHREAEILEQLGSEHPQIPNLFAFFDLPAPNIATGVDDRFFYLVQEFVEGENLEQEMLRRGHFSEADIIEILTEMLNILEFIHSHNVIHRDIKPSNIMRHVNGRLYLLDFGAIKNIAKPGSTIIYSQGYAPPEQLRGQQVFFASDLYALAATCIVLLTNESHENLFDTVRDRWQWENYAQVSAHTTVVLNKMLQNAPFDRFQSVAETRAALTGNQPISLPLPTVIPPAPTVNPTPANLATAISAGVYGVPPDPVVPIPAGQAFEPAVIPFTKTHRRLPLHQLPLPEYVGRAGFVGWQSGLIGVISNQLSLPTPILVLLGAVALIYLQWQRLLNTMTMAGIAAVSGIIALVLAKLDFVSFTATAIGGVIATIATAILFRLVYRVLSGFNQ
jgi:tRNA A-37 threonylcarbamoyl transferase component Bud32